MARTLKGNLTGRAAAEQRVDDRNETIGVPVDLKGIRERLKRHEGEAIARCIAMEGEKSFYTWYAPQDLAISERIELIENRIQKFEKNQRCELVGNLLVAEAVGRQ